MATTSARLAADVLDALTAHTDVAVLHGEAEAAEGRISSDIDVVTEVPIRRLLSGTFGQSLVERSIFPVVLWPYDVGGTATVFFVNENATEAVQLDVLTDPEGIGKLGIRSRTLLAHASPGRAWPTVDEARSLLYQVRKRHWKGQFARARDVIELIRALPEQQTAGAIDELFEPTTARKVTRMIDGVDPARLRRESAPYQVRNLFRRLRRISQPVGWWVEVTGEGADEAAALIFERFENFLPHCRREDRPTRRSAGWWLRRVAPIRLRPGVVVGVGNGTGTPADIQLAAAADRGTEAVLRRLVREMSAGIISGAR